MSPATSCPKCGVPLPSDAPEGLCPKCLLQAGFESAPQSQPPGTAASPASSSFVPPAVEELARRFPQLEILELLGKGGMGAVYKARQRGLDRLVAVKILPPEVGAWPAFAERFTREARALAQLSHSNIVGVYEFGQAEGLYYFVMEYVDGVNLREAIQAGQIQPPQALAIVPQICDALQYAHDEGIVHRDVKPENILIDKKGRVKIADFGLAKLLGASHPEMTLTGTHQVMGTLRYMAPEQMEGPKEIDHRADIYSLGVVFYELLTGELPLGRFAPPSKRVQIDVRLDEVVLRALEKEPSHRYQNASEVKSQLEVIRQSVATSSVPAAPLDSAPDRVVARRLTWILLAMFSLAAAAFIALQAGYLQGARWYFDKELPYTYLSTSFLVVACLSLVYFVWWWYLLAKDPSEVRSFSGLVRQLQTPDPRVKQLGVWLPLLFLLGAMVGAVPLFLNLAGYSDAVQTVVITCIYVILPYALLALVWRMYRPAPLSDSPPSDTAPASRVGTISLTAALSGLVAPVLLGLVGQMFVPNDRLAGYIILCFALAVGLELAAFGCGIAARRSKSGKAGIVISVISLLGALLVVSTTVVHQGTTPPPPQSTIESDGALPQMVK